MCVSVRHSVSDCLWLLVLVSVRLLLCVCRDEDVRALWLASSNIISFSRLQESIHFTSSSVTSTFVTDILSLNYIERDRGCVFLFLYTGNLRGTGWPSSVWNVLRNVEDFREVRKSNWFKLDFKDVTCLNFLKKIIFMSIITTTYESLVLLCVYVFMCVCVCESVCLCVCVCVCECVWRYSRCDQKMNFPGFQFMSTCVILKEWKQRTNQTKLAENVGIKN